MKIQTVAVIVFALVQLTLFGWAISTSWGDPIPWLLTPLTFLFGSVAALAWVATPYSRFLATVSRDLTLAALGTTLLGPVVDVVMGNPAGRTDIEHLVTHPLEAICLIPAIALIALVGRRWETHTAAVV